MKKGKRIMKMLSVALAVLLSASVFGACKPGNQPQSSDSAEKLVTYSSYKALQSLISKSLKDGLTNGYYYGMQKAAVAEGAAVDDANASRTGGDTSLTDYSKTNLQVEGVDEADIVKTDGKYLYLIENGRFIIVDAQDPAHLKVVSQIKYIYTGEDAYNTKIPIEMFLDEKNRQILLISNSYDDRLTQAILTQAAQNSSAQTASGAAEGSAKEGLIAPDYNGSYYYGQQNTLLQIIDLSDITAPSVKREFVQEGYYLSSRRIGDAIYLITNKYLYTYGENPNEDYFIPATKDSAGSGEWEMLPVGQIHVIPDRQSMNFLIVSGINTANAAGTPQSIAVMGGGEKVYASASNIYIASTRYNEDANASNGVVTYNAVDGTVQTQGPAQTSTASASAPSAISGAAAESGAEGGSTGGNTGDGSETGEISVTGKENGDEQTEKDGEDVFQIFEPPVFTVYTDIYRFAVDGGSIRENGSGVVPGTILNQFSMDENDGYFRIATTTGDAWRSDKYTSMNNVYILDAQMKTAGKLEGLASREMIKSVRFMGDKAYLVTFRTVDPLFVLDLSDPKNPSVKGELKIPGYSEYLHPISDTLVLGFGKDAIEKGDMAYYLGMKVAVFDVSDIANPKEISSMIIGGRGTYSEVEYNHKALLYSAEKNIIGFPITIYEVPDSQKADPLAYGMPVFTGYMVLGLTADNKLTEKARISHYTLKIPEGYDPYSSAKPNEWLEYEQRTAYEYAYAVNRGVFIGSTLFTISGATVRANSLGDFSETGTLDVPGFGEYSQYYYGYGDAVRVK